MISIYEGMEEIGGRQRCKEIFHISEYGLAASELWEKVLSELEKRYDLEETIIYLHGDGAAWIQIGLEWLPNSRHVLDKFHKNKSLKKVCAGLDGKTRNLAPDAIGRLKAIALGQKNPTYKAIASYV